MTDQLGKDLCRFCDHTRPHHSVNVANYWWCQFEDCPCNGWFPRFKRKKT
jgi:hypothetical protein